MERAVAHEVANELGELGSHRLRHASAEVRRPVELTERRKRNLLRLADHAVQHEWDPVAVADLAESLPGPDALGVDDLDPVSRRPLDAVAAPRLDGDDTLEAVDVELRRLPRTVVRGDLDVEALPLSPDGVAKRPEP